MLQAEPSTGYLALVGLASQLEGVCKGVREGCEGERGVRCVSCVRGRAKGSHRERGDSVHV